MKIIRSTLKHKPDPGEKPKGVSLTIPDDSYTIQELLARHEAGLGLGIQRLGNFDLEDDEEHDALDMNQYQNLDITERELLNQELKEVKSDAEEKVKRHKKRKEEEASKTDNPTS